MLSNLLKDRRILIALFIIIGLFVAGSLLKSDSLDIDKAEEGTNADYSTQANIENGEELIHALKSVRTFEALSADIRTFAVTAYEIYSEKPTGVVGFIVTSDIKNDNNDINFEGRYGAVSNRIAIKISLLSNQRFSLSITDTKTGLSFDQYLVSNSKRNQFIGTLPKTGEDFAIDYDGDGDGFIISLYPTEGAKISQAYANAADQIKTALGTDNLDNERLNIIRAGNSLAP